MYICMSHIILVRLGHENKTIDIIIHYIFVHTYFSLYKIHFT